MLHALVEGDLDASAEHAKRLQPKWGDEFCSVSQQNGRRAEVMCVNIALHRLALDAALEGDRSEPVWHGLGEIAAMAAELGASTM